MKNIIKNFKNCHILVIGDLMIDEYVWGEVDRISPEAPVQVVLVKEENATLGGAGNVVNNIAALGAKVSVGGLAGAGPNSDRLIKILNSLGADSDCVIKDPNRPTTLKTRIMASDQHVLRIDREKKLKLQTDQCDQIIRYVEHKIKSVDLILISDYGKGLLSNELIAALIKIAKDNKKIIIVDPKGLDFSKYAGASIMTPNKKEASLATGIEINDVSSLIKAGDKLMKSLELDRLLITCGKDGMYLFGPDKKPFHIKTKARQVFDVSGAGDTVAAVLGLALSSGASYKKAASLANTAAGIVVGKIGTATVSLEEFQEKLYFNKNQLSHKFCNLKNISKRLEKLKNNNQRIVLTNGCFDLLHAGHIEFLSASKQLGDILIVALDSDDSVSAIKGDGRPVIMEKERVRIMCALDSVDYVTVFSTGELEKLLEIVKPHVLTKGSNYKAEKVFGHEIVEKQGGEVVLIPVTAPISSSHIIQKIKSSYS